MNAVDFAISPVSCNLMTRELMTLFCRTNTLTEPFRGTRFVSTNQKSAGILARIISHPFNQGLYRGTLSSRVFQLYLQQDRLYLRDFSRALRLTAQRFTNERHAQQFYQLADNMVESERKVNLHYLNQFHPASFFEHGLMIQRAIPVITNYTAHLLETVEQEPLEVAVASLVPCFWIYYELGKQMTMAGCKQDNPYRKWIATYSGERFTASTQALVQTMTELNEPVECDLLSQKISHSFLQSMRFELGFFDAVYPSTPLVQPEPAQLNIA
ncbi:TenA family protein [Legionella fairfieldensis]|uniref:TenA family protein n=1 Tax=Legionella fairfieldensis TaxID=45064 RepID=UPI0012EBA0F4|nr:TenA family protein [Legionella fairfieldensis]